MSALQRLGERLRALVVTALALLGGLALVQATPLGPLARMAWQAAHGLRYRGPSPLASYRGEGGRSYGFLLPADDKAVAFIVASSSCLSAGLLQQIAEASAVDAASLRALVDAHASVEAGACRVQLPAALEAQVVELLPGGTSREGLRADPELSARGLARLLAARRSVFVDTADPDGLALEAVLLGREAVQRALTVARAAGVARAEDFEAHRAHLPSSATAAADAAVAVLARARLARMLWPVETRFRITSPFGERLHPVLKVAKFHNGVDVAVPVGTPIRSVLDGNVTRVASDNVSGRYVRVAHGLGIEAVYCHLERAQSAELDAVQRGQAVALSGNTGRSTGPHLHFTLRLYGRPIDPLGVGAQDSPGAAPAPAEAP
jgi:murein DD-endopeptidase MepM/ murein hydrolase activator NlpD